MPSSDEQADKPFRILFGACNECNTPLYYPPVKVPSVTGMRWDPVDPTRAVAEMKNVCIKKRCYKAAIATYRAELEQGEIVIDGIRPMPHRKPAAASPEAAEEENND